MNHRFFYNFIGVAAGISALGVMMGAFGAHSLKPRISTEYMEVLKTGVLYLFIHALAIFGTCILALRSPDSRLLKFTCIIFLIGILFFSGSLFLISTKEVTGFAIGAFGIVTPFGGMFFLTGWFSLLIWGLKAKGTDRA